MKKSSWLEGKASAGLFVMSPCVDEDAHTNNPERCRRAPLGLTLMRHKMPRRNTVGMPLTSVPSRLCKVCFHSHVAEKHVHEKDEMVTVCIFDR